MTAICNETDLSAYVGYGYIYEQEPQFGASVTTLDGTDHTAKLRDKVRLTVPFIPLSPAQLSAVLQLFPENSAYVTWTYYDYELGRDRTAQFKYEKRTSSLKVHYRNGTEYLSGLVLVLTER